MAQINENFVVGRRLEFGDRSWPITKVIQMPDKKKVIIFSGDYHFVGKITNDQRVKLIKKINYKVKIKAQLPTNCVEICNDEYKVENIAYDFEQKIPTVKVSVVNHRGVRVNLLGAFKNNAVVTLQGYMRQKMN